MNELPIDINKVELKHFPYIIPNSIIISKLSKKLNEYIEKNILKYQNLDIIDSILKLCEDNNIRYDDIEEYIYETDIVKNLTKQNKPNKLCKMGIF